jgi:hypothetical protein
MSCRPKIGATEEMLWKGTRMYGFVSYSFAKPARPKIYDWETEEKF